MNSRRAFAFVVCLAIAVEFQGCVNGVFSVPQPVEQIPIGAQPETQEFLRAARNLYVANGGDWSRARGKIEALLRKWVIEAVGSLSVAAVPFFDLETRIADAVVPMLMRKIDALFGD